MYRKKNGEIHWKVYLLIGWGLLAWPSHSYPSLRKQNHQKVFTIANSSDSTQEYLVDFSRWGEVEVFELEGTEAVFFARTGELVPQHLRTFQFDNSCHIPVILPPGESKTFRSTLSKMRYGGAPPLDLDIPISSRSEVIDELWTARTINLGAIGILVFIFCYNLLLYLSTRLDHYRLYLLLVFVMILEVFRESGLAEGWIRDPDFFLHYKRYTTAILNFLLCTLSPLVLRKFLGLEARLPRLRRFFRYYPYLCITIASISLVDFGIAQYLLIICLPGLLASIFAIVFLNMLWGYRNGVVLFVGVSVLLVCTFIHWLGLSGIVDLDLRFSSIFRSIGTITNDAALSYILGRWAWDLKKQNDLQHQKIVAHIRQEQSQQQRISIFAMEARENEREEIAQRLHDELQNDLVGFQLGFQSLETGISANKARTYLQLEEQMENLINQVRRISHEFMPAHLGKQGGLENSLKHLAEKISAIGPQVTVNFDLPRSLGLQLRALCFRIVKELVTNALKHAAADQIHIMLKEDQGMLFLQVCDNGTGFDSSGPSMGKGLEQLSYIATVSGGSLEIHSQAGKGTEVEVKLPIHPMIPPQP